MMKIVYLSLVALVCLSGIHVVQGNDCQTPNPNEALCISIPSDAVADCNNADALDCDSFKHYEVENFPDGPVEDNSETAYYTKEEQADCWRSAACGLNPNGTPQCTEIEYHGSWHAAAKIVTNQTSICREPPQT